MNFNYYSFTKIYFGEHENNIGNIIKEYGFKKVLFHYGMSSIKKTGLYDIIVNSLNKANIEFIELGGVMPNPKIDKVREGVKIVKENNIDFILAVGGGSVIDSAKAIAVGAKVDFDPWLFSSHEKTPEGSLKVGVVLTISAAGSELSNSCVITNDKLNVKNGFNSDLIRPLFVIENPNLTKSVSLYQTGCGIVDILMHTLERYLTDCKPIDLADKFAEGLMKNVMHYGKIVVDDLNNYEARANLMLASSFSHNGLTGMNGKMYFTVHKLEHVLSGNYDHISHGAGLSVLFCAWARYVYKYLPERFKQFSINVMEVDHNLNDDEIINLGIDKLENYFKLIKMPTRLHELGNDIDIEMLANKITKNDMIKVVGFKQLNKLDVMTIFNNCR